MRFYRRNLIYLLGALFSVLLLTGAAPQSQLDTPLLGFHIARGDAAHLAAARAAGGGFAVKVFSWADIEPEPNYLYWERPDATLRAAKFYDVEIVARLDRPPEWALDDSSPTPWNVEAYANFVRRVTERYEDRLAGIIIWNEPNTALEWANQPPDPAAYVALLEAAYDSAKAVNPDLAVLLAGLAFTEGDGTNLNDLTYLEQLYEAGGGTYFDILAAHAYGFGQLPADPPAPDRLNFRRLELHRQIMAANGDEDKPVWVTEAGWRTSAPNPEDSWQVVSPAEQARYSQQALAYASRNYPWLERLALWELNSGGDDYGYYLWHGPDEVSLAYQALVGSCERYHPACRTDPAVRSPDQAPAPASIPIVASDVIIRLGDRGTLHPHWVHLHRGGEDFSPDWQGDFFLTAEQSRQRYDLLLEVMQVDQPANRIALNGVELGYLDTRTRPDQTSTWVTQRFELPDGLVWPGLNTLEVAVGPRNPTHQYAFWRWENMQFRNVRLVPARNLIQPLIEAWLPEPSPSGWSEAIRLRPGPEDEFWLTGNRCGQLWRGDVATPGLQNEAANRPDLLFTDVLFKDQSAVATTDQGLYWRLGPEVGWRAVVETPASYAYVVIEAGDRFYAGFGEQGVWSAAEPVGPWQPAGLAGRTVLDLAYEPISARLYAATDGGVFRQTGPDDSWQPLPPLPGEAGNPDLRFSTRLFLSRTGAPVVRALDRLWRWDDGAKEWASVGPEELDQANQLYAVLDCCEAGTIVAGRYAGLWQLDPDGEWQRLDADDTFEVVIGTDLIRIENVLYAAGMLGLFQSSDNGANWRKVEGLPSTVSDLLVDPADPSRWVAGTPAGIYRSDDGGRSWAAISPPWTVWDMAFGPEGRLFVARSGGVAWVDELGRDRVAWQESDGLDRVLFFAVKPHPTDPELLWAGTWGNDIGVSEDGGQTIESLGNGLETLSVLDLLWHPTPGQVTAATIEGLYRTDDGGESWFKLPGPLSRQTVYHLRQTDDGAILAAAADGLWATADYGATWDRVESMPVATVLRLGRLSLPDGQAWLWAGTEADGLWLSADRGRTWSFGGLPGRSVYNLLLDPQQPERLVAATDHGIFSAMTVTN
jgi:photosystem II stability/assembly factor-like uncharacterized protein